MNKGLIHKYVIAMERVLDDSTTAELRTRYGAYKRGMDLGRASVIMEMLGDPNMQETVKRADSALRDLFKNIDKVNEEDNG